MKSLKGVLVLSLVLMMGVGAFVLLSPQVQAESNEQHKIAYVNLQKIFNNHPEKLKAESRFNQVVQTLQQNLKTELEAKLKDVSGEKRQQLINQYKQRLNREVNERQQKLIKPVMQKIDATIKEVAAEQGVDIVVEKGVVIYGGYDLTPKVLAKVKAETGDKTKN